MFTLVQSYTRWKLLASDFPGAQGDLPDFSFGTSPNNIPQTRGRLVDTVREALQCRGKGCGLILGISQFQAQLLTLAGSLALDELL